MAKKNKIPVFKNEDDEREFWSKYNLSKHFRSPDFEDVSFPNLKPSSCSISLRIPVYILVRLKEQANALNIPYQSLMKKYIAQCVLSKYKAL